MPTQPVAHALPFNECEYFSFKAQLMKGSTDHHGRDAMFGFVQELYDLIDSAHAYAIECKMNESDSWPLIVLF